MTVPQPYLAAAACPVWLVPPSAAVVTVLVVSAAPAVCEGAALNTATPSRPRAAPTARADQRIPCCMTFSCCSEYLGTNDRCTAAPSRNWCRPAVPSTSVVVALLGCGNRGHRGPTAGA